MHLNFIENFFLHYKKYSNLQCIACSKDADPLQDMSVYQNVTDRKPFHFDIRVFAKFSYA